VIGADFFPTILDLAGLPLLPQQHLDGTSLLPLLQGKSMGPRDLIWHYPHYGNQGGEPCSIIRRGDWKLIHYLEDQRDELYNLANDEQEQHDCASEQPEIVKRLRARLDNYLAQVGAKMPTINPRYDAKLAEKQAEQMRTKRLPSLEKQHARFLDPKFVPNPTWWNSRPRK
jgi:arylsulfatase A-like enzyme